MLVGLEYRLSPTKITSVQLLGSNLHHTQWLSTYLSSIIPHYRCIPFSLIVLLRRTFTEFPLYRENVVARLVSLKAVPLLWVLTSRWITAYVDTRYSSDRAVFRLSVFDSYVSLVGTGHLDKAAIFNKEGTSVWATSQGFTVRC